MATARRQLGYVSSLTTQTVTAGTYGVATGGSSSSITVGGQAYTLLTFTSTGTLTVSSAGLFDVTLVAGGGGGSEPWDPGTDRCGAGGGGGAYIQTTVYLDANQTVTIGGGGAGGAGLPGGANDEGDRGGITTLGTLLKAVGGGGGIGFPNSVPGYQHTGGNGGGGATTTAAVYRTGGLSVFGLFNGGEGINAGTAGGGGGGGGNAAVGGTATATVGGAGGAGYDLSTWIGQSAGTTYVGGGGGGGGPTTGGAGGSGGGAAGGSGNANGSNATANTGGGGGGAGKDANSGGNGGSGIVYVRFKV